MVATFNLIQLLDIVLNVKHNVGEVKMKKAESIEVAGMKAVTKGTIRIKFLNIPVKLFTGVQERESTHLKRLCPDCDGEVGNKFKCKGCEKDLEYGEIQKGYRVAKDQVVKIEEHELDWLKGDTPSAIDGIKTISKSSINPSCYLKPYFLCPQDVNSVQPFEVFRTALEESDKALLCKIAIRSDVRYAVIYPEKNRLIAHTMRYGTEMRDIEQLPMDDSVVDAGSVQGMKAILDKMQGTFSPDELEDGREEKFKDFISKKIAGEEIDIPKNEIELPDNNFAEQIQASLEAMENVDA